MKKILIMKWFFYIVASLFCIMATTALARQLAFPGAEGFGRYTTGGRGGRVIEVTNLNDSGSGSLRDAVNQSGKRTIVFHVSGTIILNSELRIRNGDVTIAGQTAPGEGICLRDYTVTVDADNVIIRYLRFRLGDVREQENDALNGRNRQNIIIDHCSMSWSVDETVSFYDNKNFTMQWCIISESLYHSTHLKGEHGYGGIWGGQGATFHHNLIAHHSSRNPRFNGSRYSRQPDLERVDHRNNVIFNWGGNSAYGGEGGNQNMVANYYKPGPASSIKNRIIEPYDKLGRWYVEDNYIEGDPVVTADNWHGGVQGSNVVEAIRLYEPFAVEPVLTHTAENAFLEVLADAGATLPKRDAVDNRIVTETKTGVATYGGAFGANMGIIDTQNEVGGWPELQSASAAADTDHDGMPDAWEDANGLEKKNPDDGNEDANGDGYTNLENYLNSILRTDFLLAPAEFIAIPLSAGEVQLSWKEQSQGETGFVVERAESAAGPFKKVGVSAENKTGYVDGELTAGTVYYYRLRAENKTAASNYTNVASVQTITADGR